MKISNDTIGNRTAMPQTTKPSRDPSPCPELCILHVDITILLTVKANKFHMSTSLYNM